MGLFNKAKTKAKSGDTKAPKRSTTWRVGDPDGDKVSKSLKELVRLSSEAKAIDAKMGIHKQVVYNHANDSFISDFSNMGVMPDTPMKIVNSDGDTVTFVVQDRGGQYKLKDDQIEAMNEILGADVVEGLLYTQTTIGFNRSVMAMPGVSETIEKALEGAVKKLLRDGTLDEESADDLLTVDEKVAFKPGTLDRAATLVGQDKTRLSKFLAAMNSSVCRYVKI